jgi:transposase InsO family protein
LWKDNYCVYGAHKLWKTARRAGHDVGRDQVARLMRAAGSQGVRRGKRVRTTKPDPARRRGIPIWSSATSPRPPPNQLWVTDLVRHEALFDRVEVRDHYFLAVAAAG